MSAVLKPTNVESELDSSDQQKAAVVAMLIAVERIQRVSSIEKYVMTSAGKDIAASKNGNGDWADFSFIISHTSGTLERAWKEHRKSLSPKGTIMYFLSHAISWDLYNLVNSTSSQSAISFVDLYERVDAMPIEIIFETAARSKHHTYKREKAVKPDGTALMKNNKQVTNAVSEYTVRSSQPNVVSVAYPGLYTHYDWKQEGSYYQNAVPIGAILDKLREFTLSGVLLPVKGTIYQATFVYCWYERIIATVSYYKALNEYLISTNQQPESKFDFIHMLVMKDDSSCTWFALLTKARQHAYDTCKIYVETIGRDNSTEILSGINPTELANNPSQIGVLLENILGIKGLGPDVLAKIPGFDKLTSIIKDFGSSSPA